MKNKVFVLAVLFLGLGSLSAQSFVGKLNPYPTLNRNSSDTLKILAVLAQFQPDKDDATFGDGTFGSIYSEDYGTTIIDPLPHDVKYFANHMEFAKNYYTKVSGGKLTIDYKILENIVTLSKTMRNYAPPTGDKSNFSNLGEFSKEVWQLTEQANPDLDFSEYDLFLVFHAGVGHDIEVPGSIGNDKDLPSVYLSPKSLRKIYGEDFEGFEVGTNNFKINNTLLMPETESRELKGIGGTTLLELSINGLMVASIASHLGLPDLFDTETGLSAIGRFGLMDGQSIFTYNGLFPPEPSPWEKMFLGWIEPTVINDFKEKEITLTALRAAVDGDTSLVKIPISSTEYYLVENRARDAKEDGCTVTYRIGEREFTRTFSKDFPSFSYYDADTIDGVVVDVDEFDWAVPGDERKIKDNFEDVGIVIWHIDEAVINEKFDDNKINTDKKRRGVKVVEADGIFDIGEKFNTVFGDEVIGEGTKEDTWYRNNTSKVEYYKNRFDGNSTPASVSNTGAKSLIGMYDFSDPKVKMTFKLTFGEKDIKQLASIELKADELKSIAAGSANNSSLFVFGDEKAYRYTADGNLINEIDFVSQYKPVVTSIEDKEVIIGVDGKNIKAIKFNVMSVEEKSFTLDENISAPLVQYQTGADNVSILCGLENGGIKMISVDKDLKIIEIGQQSISLLNPIKQIATDGTTISAISVNKYWNNETGIVELDNEIKSLALTKDSEDVVNAVILSGDNNFDVIRKGAIYSSFVGTNKVNEFALADLIGTGDNQIIFADGNEIKAYNFIGNPIDNYPYQTKDRDEITSQILIAPLDADKSEEFISITEDGKIFGNSGIEAESLTGYPLTAGNTNDYRSILFIDGVNLNLAVVSGKRMSVWKIAEAPASMQWTQQYGNSGNTAFVKSANSENVIKEFFPMDKAYNWPNPVYQGETYFRFFVNEDAKVDIKIFDLAGDMVDDLKGSATGGVDNQILWNVKDVQSGVYFAYLSVTGNSGKSDQKIIKVAVIK